MTEKRVTYISGAVGGRILSIRGLKVLLDADLAVLYGVSTKRLNEQVKRNKSRFPVDFAFRLTAKEKNEVVAKCDHLRNLRFSPGLPLAFTEHGAIMAANVLNSSRAIKMGVHVVRTFVRLREVLADHRDLAFKLDQLERKVGAHDGQIQAVFDAVRRLMREPEKPKKRIGFTAEERRVGYSAGTSKS